MKPTPARPSPPAALVKTPTPEEIIEMLKRTRGYINHYFPARTNDQLELMAFCKDSCRHAEAAITAALASNRAMAESLTECVAQIRHLEELRTFNGGPSPATLTPDILEKADKLLARHGDGAGK